MILYIEIPHIQNDTVVFFKNIYTFCILQRSKLFQKKVNHQHQIRQLFQDSWYCTPWNDSSVLTIQHNDNTIILSLPSLLGKPRTQILPHIYVLPRLSGLPKLANVGHVGFKKNCKFIETHSRRPGNFSRRGEYARAIFGHMLNCFHL